VRNPKSSVALEIVMDDVEPPSKLRKLSHDGAADGQPSVNAAPDQRKPVINAANGADSDTGSDSDDENDVSIQVNQDELQVPGVAAGGETTRPMSKNQLKKLRKKREWEAGRDYRKAKRKQKTAEKRIRKRAARDEALAQGLEKPSPSRYQRPVLLPITFIIDCGFDDLMADKERISLASQLTRAYSDNSRAPFQAHLAISSWGGALRERFDTVLSKHYENWKGVQYEIEDFAHAAKLAKERMGGLGGGKLAGTFRKYATGSAGSSKYPEAQAHQTGPEIPSESQEVATAQSGVNEAVATGPFSPKQLTGELELARSSHPLPEPEIVYLTSDSPHTLDQLNPYSSYIIGGLVDKNRHKGICYKKACDKSIKTAKLPIGDYMEMQSRFVLATNHVVEIMLRWLECGDWGEAFMKVIPKRKGGKLRADGDASSSLPPDGDATDEG
jgi:tRNA (guanine9-N1)-methyltransferase